MVAVTFNLKPDSLVAITYLPSIPFFAPQACRVLEEEQKRGRS